MLLDNKIAFISGAASGIGEACARLFVEEGATVILADMNAERGSLLAGELGHKASFITCDVTNETQVSDTLDKIVEQHGRLDCAVNSAGVTGDPAPLDAMSLDDWQRVLSINLDGVFICLKHQLRRMQRHGGGAIVNIASGAGVIPVPNMASYCASKHGVLGLTKTAAKENVNNGIRVNAVLPGSIKTPMLDKTLALGAEVEKMILNSVPCGRFGEATEVAQSVAWLCSDRASYISGDAMSVDYATICK